MVVTKVRGVYGGVSLVSYILFFFSPFLDWVSLWGGIGWFESTVGLLLAGRFPIFPLVKCAGMFVRDVEKMKVIVA